MRLFILSLISFSFFTFGLPVTVSAEEKFEAKKYSTTVKLVISAQEESENQIYSYISRELRSLGDVKLVKDNSTWTIDIIASQIKDKTGYIGGITFSIVILKRFDIPVESLMLAVRAAFGISPEHLEKSRELRQFMEEQFNFLEETFTEINTTCNISNIVHHSIRAGDNKDLQSICQEIVADFDAEHLKKERDKRQKKVR
jgi:hypothetical protein